MQFLDIQTLDEFAPISVLAAMLYPLDPSLRSQVVAFARDQAPIGDESSSRYQMLNFARSELIDQKLLERGFMSGEILLVLRQIYEYHLDSRTDEPSVSKAIEVVTARYRGGRASLPKSRKSLEDKVWTRFKSVAHLWAAFRLVAELLERNSPDFDRLDPSDPATLPSFLALAEDMRIFGETAVTRARKREGGYEDRKPILDPSEIWRTPLDLHLPKIIFTAKVLGPLQDRDLRAYVAYRAPKRG